jgi:hypothetical protein
LKIGCPVILHEKRMDRDANIGQQFLHGLIVENRLPLFNPFEAIRLIFRHPHIRRGITSRESGFGSKTLKPW